MTTASAPGKAFICGEYAVLVPKTPALVLAVDRRTRVEATPSGSWSIESGGVRWREGQPVIPEVEFVEATISSMRDRYHLSPRKVRTSDDMHADGLKLGLGGSAAVTVATAFALAPKGTNRNEVWGVADEVHRTVQGGRGSGADVAASVFGGVISYTSEPKSATAMPLHPDLRFLLAWSGASASTAPRLLAWSEFAAKKPKWVKKFVETSRSVSDIVGQALEFGNPAVLRAAIASAGSLMRALQQESGIALETEALKAACDAAWSVGACGKISGAGGGDCAIILALGDETISAAATAIESKGLKAIAVKPGAAAESS